MGTPNGDSQQFSDFLQSRPPLLAEPGSAEGVPPAAWPGRAPAARRAARAPAAGHPGPAAATTGGPGFGAAAAAAAWAGLFLPGFTTRD